MHSRPTHLATIQKLSAALLLGDSGERVEGAAQDGYKGSAPALQRRSDDAQRLLLRLLRQTLATLTTFGARRAPARRVAAADEYDVRHRLHREDRLQQRVERLWKRSTSTSTSTEKRREKKRKQNGNGNVRVEKETEEMSKKK